MRPLTYVSHFGVVVAAIAVITMLRAWYVYTEPFDLFFDESQYWGWSKDLAWGYYSKPPVLATLIAVFHTVCGSDSVFCIRLPSVVVHAITSLVVYAIAMRVYQDRVIAGISAIGYLLLPAVTLSSTLISTDVPLLFVWSLALYCFIRAYQSNHILWWVCAGMIAGVGMLTKYNMLLFAVSALLFLLLTPAYRDHLKRPYFWLACVLCMAVFAPNIWWNYQHDFVSFLHTRDNAQGGGITLNVESLLAFFGAQFGVFGPIFMGVLLVLLFRWRLIVADERHRLMLCFILPMLLVILVVSLLSRAHANWAAPIYISATIMVSAWLVESQKYKVILAQLVICIVLWAGFVGFAPVTRLMGVTLTGKTTSLSELKVKDPFVRVKGWSELGEQVKTFMAQYPEAELLTYMRKAHAQLMYYANQSPDGITKWKWDPNAPAKDHYELTTKVSDNPNQAYLMVSIFPDQKRVIEQFNTAEPLGAIEIELYEDYTMTYYVHYLKGLNIASNP